MTPHSNDQHAELLELCGVVRDARLTPEQAERLECLLRESAEARQIYVRFMQLDAYFDPHDSDALTTTASDATPWDPSLLSLLNGISDASRPAINPPAQAHLNGLPLEFNGLGQGSATSADAFSAPGAIPRIVSLLGSGLLQVESFFSRPVPLALVCSLVSVAAVLAVQRPLALIPDSEESGSCQSEFLEMVGDEVQAVATATFGKYVVTLVGQGFFDAFSAQQVDVRTRGLYRDYYYNNSTQPGEGVTLSIGGVSPNTAYELKLWTYDADQWVSSTPTTWEPHGNTSGTKATITNFGKPRPVAMSEHCATLQLTTTTDALEVFGTTTAGIGGTRLNGFQLIGPQKEILVSVDFGRTGTSSGPVGQISSPTDK